MINRCVECNSIVEIIEHEKNKKIYYAALYHFIIENNIHNLCSNICAVLYNKKRK